jgi:hypothetical protein
MYKITKYLNKYKVYKRFIFIFWISFKKYTIYDSFDIEFNSIEEAKQAITQDKLDRIIPLERTIEYID